MEEYIEWYETAKMFRGLDMHEEAIGCYHSAVMSNPECFEIYNREALDCCVALLQKEPKNDSAWFKKGEILFFLDKREEAMKCYNTALNINPDNADALCNKGALLLSHKPLEALKCFERAIKIKTRYAHLWFNRGMALKASGEYTEALASLQKGLELCPDDEDAQKCWGGILKDLISKKI